MDGGEEGQIGLRQYFTMGNLGLNIYPLQINEIYLHAKSEPSRMKKDEVIAKILGTSKFRESLYKGYIVTSNQHLHV